MANTDGSYQDGLAPFLLQKMESLSQCDPSVLNQDSMTAKN